MATDPGAHAISLSVAYRRLFGTADGYRFDIGFAVRARRRTSPDAVVRRVAETAVAVADFVSDVPLWRAGPRIAHRLDSVTGSGTADFGRPGLMPGAPAILLEREDSAPAGVRVARLVSAPAAMEVNNAGAEVHMYELVGRRAERRTLRQVRASMWRLHMEVELLRCIGRLATREGIESLHGHAVMDAVGRLAGSLGHQARFGLAQPPVLALAAYPHRLEPLLELAERVESQSLGLSRALQIAAERALMVRAASAGIRVIQSTVVHKKEEVVVNMKGDKIKATGGSTVVNRSAVLNSFNQLQASAPELADALRQVQELVVGSGDDAIDLSNELIELAAGGKRNLFRAAWERLKEIAPVVGGLGDAASAIEAFLSAN